LKGTVFNKLSFCFFDGIAWEMRREGSGGLGGESSKPEKSRSFISLFDILLAKINKKMLLTQRCDLFAVYLAQI
jgi:hypothetical protein